MNNLGMQELVDLINKHNYNYYVLDNPTISDAEWDKMYDHLEKLEKETGVVLPDSPTRRVGGGVVSGFIKHQHEFRVYSLDKVRSVEDLESWISDVKKEDPNAEFSLEYKFDGLTLLCEYKGGLLKAAYTRGNGLVGEVVTEQVRTIKSVPASIPFKGKLVVHGEGMMMLSSLKAYNKAIRNSNITPLKNARNGVAGGIRNLDPKETAKRNLDYIAYDILFADGEKLESQSDMVAFLKKNGFKTSDYFKVVKTTDMIKEEIKNIEELKNSLDFLTDGVVLKLNSIKEREEIGYTSKFPKWAMAYKFEAEEISTELLSVNWQVGRTGKLTPIALIDSVELAGATIERATLNNIEDIRRKQLKLNSMVLVRRSNEVIPEILGVAQHTEKSSEIEEPTCCPCCGSAVVKKGPNLFCENRYGCREQIIDRITHFASREGFDIVGFSEKTASALYERGLRSPSELFSLEKEELLKLDKVKEKKAENFANSIEKSKNIEFNKFLYALGISEVGTKMSKDLSKRFGNLQSFLNATKEDFVGMYDVGEVMAEGIVQFILNPENLKEINNLIEAGVKIKERKIVEVKSELSGKTVVLTGTLSNFARHEAIEKIEQLGGQSVSSVSKNTGIVLAGENAGSKLVKAKEIGIRIMTEEEFLKIIKECL